MFTSQCLFVCLRVLSGSYKCLKCEVRTALSLEQVVFGVVTFFIMAEMYYLAVLNMEAIGPDWPNTAAQETAL